MTLKDYYAEPHVTVREIQLAVCKSFRVHPIEMVSARRGAEVAHPRQVAMFLARDLTPFSFPHIGRLFGGRDHTTIMHGVKTVERKVAEDRYLAARVNRLRSQLVSIAPVA